MSLGQVHYMNVVTHAGAINRWIIVAKERQLRQLAYRHLGDVWQKVVGYAVRVLADLTAFVGTHRVEVTQQCDAPARVCRGQDSQQLSTMNLLRP